MIVANPRLNEGKLGFPWTSSLLLSLAGIGLLGSLFFPLWRITLDAPQYPEGMGMHIWARTITGENPHDLEIINELNHYIGMKKIIPESIPELRFISPLILFFALLTFLNAARPRVATSAVLLGALSALGAFGLYDFWRWEYDYGHNLNPMAAIKVPGMSYQPPLIGEAKLLNFLSTSWPALGGYLLFLAGGFIALSLVVSWRRRSKSKWPGHFSSRQVTTSLMVFCLILMACEKGPIPFLWGEDACHFCKMTLVQKGFAAQRINDKGKVFKFDAIECLLGDLKIRPLGPMERVFISDWSRPEAELSLAQAGYYLKSQTIQSPMGGALAGFLSKDSALVFQTRLGGTVMDWNVLQKL